MRLNDLYPFPEERKTRKRLGRGDGSGLGKTSGKGHKGQNARAGGGVKAGFEGGQMPLMRRLPKRGFKNFKFKVNYEVINLDRIQEAFAGIDNVTIEDIYTRGLCKYGSLVKILGQGDMKSAMTIQAHRFSETACEKIKAAGGKCDELLACPCCNDTPEANASCGGNCSCNASDKE